MKKAVAASVLSLVLMLFVAGCGCSRTQEAVQADTNKQETTAVEPEIEVTPEPEHEPAPEAAPEPEPEATPEAEAKPEVSPEPESNPEAEPESVLDGKSTSGTDDVVDDPSITETVDTGVLVGTDTIEQLIGWGTSTWGVITDIASEELESRVNSVPTHAEVGQEVVATENLSVSVVSVEAGPYDYLDHTSTTMVTVRMHNTSDHTIVVKASNWDADTTTGLREDHKYVILGEDNQVIAQSFTTARITPGATYEAVVYFDGDLVSVIYEPHWLVSSENQYIYFDL